MELAPAVEAGRRRRRRASGEGAGGSWRRKVGEIRRTCAKGTSGRGRQRPWMRRKGGGGGGRRAATRSRRRRGAAARSRPPQPASLLTSTAERHCPAHTPRTPPPATRHPLHHPAHPHHLEPTPDAAPSLPQLRCGRVLRPVHHCTSSLCTGAHREAAWGVADSCSLPRRATTRPSFRSSRSSMPPAASTAPIST